MEVSFTDVYHSSQSLIGIWFGDEEVLKEFISSLNQFGVQYGLSFKYEFGKSVIFLDILVEFNNNQINTSIYVKPTDSPISSTEAPLLHLISSRAYPSHSFAVPLCYAPLHHLETPTLIGSMINW